MTEAILKGILLKHLRIRFPSFVIFRFEDRFTHGIPDISVNGNKITSWYEVKYANPNFGSKGIQELTTLRLANASSAMYVVYYELDKIKRTYLVHPKEIGKPIGSWDLYTDGFDHDWIATWVEITHTRK